MSDYLDHLHMFSVNFDADTEFVTSAGQKLQLSASGDIIVQRPDKAHIDRLGQLTDAEIVYDGKTISILGHKANMYYQLPSEHGLDLAVEDFRVETGAEVPGADLLVTDTYAVLTEGVVERRVSGNGLRRRRALLSPGFPQARCRLADMGARR